MFARTYMPVGARSPNLVTNLAKADRVDVVRDLKVIHIVQILTAECADIHAHVCHRRFSCTRMHMGTLATFER